MDTNTYDSTGGGAIPFTMSLRLGLSPPGMVSRRDFENVCKKVVYFFGIEYKANVY